MKSQIYCNNCGKQGHLHGDCKIPITSIGIIVFRYNKNKEREYLMIRRKDTFGYVEFSKGKYNINNEDCLLNWIDEMTFHEKQKVINIINQKKNNETPLDDYTCKLFENLIKQSKTYWTEPEWGFPKGRRNHQERDIVCGTREFCEETGVKKEKIKIIENIIPYEETFMGSNYKSYKHKYYIAYMDNCNDLKTPTTYQKTEVSKMEWKNIDEAYTCIRPYNLEKKEMLEKIHNMLNNYNFKNLNNLN
jgi:8-oxo-dGTP pyrophosphatase MutT (NUDIX family)